MFSEIRSLVHMGVCVSQNPCRDPSLPNKTGTFIFAVPFCFLVDWRVSYPPGLLLVLYVERIVFTAPNVFSSRLIETRLVLVLLSYSLAKNQVKIQIQHDLSMFILLTLGELPWSGGSHHFFQKSILSLTILGVLFWSMHSML